MPNYSLVINSQFKPYSFKEMLEPLLLYREAYKEAEDKYNTLAEGANTLESMLNKDLDTEEYQQYQDYLRNVESASEKLSKEGLSLDLRNLANKYKADFIKKITPIQQAAERRNNMLNAEQQLGPGYVFEYDASNTPLKKFMENPVFFPKRINIDKIRERSAAEFGQISKELQNFAIDPNMYKNDFDSTVVAKYGYNKKMIADIAEQIRNGEANISDVAADMIYRNIYNSTGVDSWSNNLELGQNAVRNAIAEGVIGAMGQYTPQIVTDKKSLEDYKHQKRMDEINAKHEATTKTQEDVARAKEDAKRREELEKILELVNPLPLRSGRELSKYNKQLNKWIGKGFITQDENGDYYITDKGKNDMYYHWTYMSDPDKDSDHTYYANDLYTYKDGKQSVSRQYVGISDFGRFIESIYGKDLRPKVVGHKTLHYANGIDNTKLNESIKYNKPDSYDINRTTEFDIQLGETYGKEALKQLNSALSEKNKGVFDVVDWNGDKFERIEEKSMNTDDSRKTFGKNPRISNYRVHYNPNTHLNEITALVQSDNGGKYRINVPRGINVTVEANIDEAIENAYTYNEIIENGHKPKITTYNGTVILDMPNNRVEYTDELLSDEDKKELENRRDEAYAKLYKSIMKLVRLAKTSDIDYSKISDNIGDYQLWSNQYEDDNNFDIDDLDIDDFDIDNLTE